MLNFPETCFHGINYFKHTLNHVRPFYKVKNEIENYFDIINDNVLFNVLRVYFHDGNRLEF